MARSLSPVYAYAWLNVVLGATLALTMATPLAPAALDALAVVFPGALPAEVGASVLMAQLLAGVLGGVWAGWGVALVGGHHGWSQARILLSSVGAWFVLDQIASVAAGAWGNVVVNTVFGLLALGAVALRRRSA